MGKEVEPSCSTCKPGQPQEELEVRRQQHVGGGMGKMVAKKKAAATAITGDLHISSQSNYRLFINSSQKS